MRRGRESTKGIHTSRNHRPAIAIGSDGESERHRAGCSELVGKIDAHLQLTKAADIKNLDPHRPPLSMRGLRICRS